MFTLKKTLDNINIKSIIYSHIILNNLKIKIAMTND